MDYEPMVALGTHGDYRLWAAISAAGRAHTVWAVRPGGDPVEYWEEVARGFSGNGDAAAWAALHQALSRLAGQRLSFRRQGAGFAFMPGGWEA
jgi:hypothetical protein